MNFTEIKALVSLGGWIVLSLFFMGQAAGYIPSPVTRLETTAVHMNESLAEHRVRQEVLIDRLTTALRVMCENGARLPSETNNCRNIR